MLVSKMGFRARWTKSLQKEVGAIKCKLLARRGKEIIPRDVCKSFVWIRWYGIWLKFAIIQQEYNIVVIGCHISRLHLAYYEKRHRKYKLRGDLPSRTPLHFWNNHKLLFILVQILSTWSSHFNLLLLCDLNLEIWLCERVVQACSDMWRSVLHKSISVSKLSDFDFTRGCSLPTRLYIVNLLEEWLWSTQTKAFLKSKNIIATNWPSDLADKQCEMSLKRIQKSIK